MDGWELLKTLHADPRLNAIPMFSLTAYHDPVIASKALKAGFAACYPKPATTSIIDDMQALVQNAARPRGLGWCWDDLWR
jgi:CheY-like chemotaxis protein